MSIIESIRDWVSAECTNLKEFRELFIDYLDDHESYMLEITPSDPVVKNYTNGDCIKRLQFSFCSRVVYDGIENVDTSEFYSKFSKWLEDCNKTGNLPALTGKQESKSIKALTSGYLYDESGKMAQYRIQLEFQYFEYY